MKHFEKKIVAVVGPTASGKTGLAVFLAKKFSAIGGPASGWNGCEIVSADSRQIFRGLDIGTGKDLHEFGKVKYHLIDICQPGENFTLFDWLKASNLVIEDIFSRGKLPIIVGGTGLYVQALTQGFELKKNKILNIKNKKYQREELDKMPLAELQVIVNSLPNKLKPKAYNLDSNNPRRLIRFIERAQSGEEMTKVKPDFSVLQIGINLPREELYQKIDQRAEQWFADGIMKEVEDLLNQGVSPDWLIRLGLEYRIITEYIIQNSKSNDLKLFEQMKQELKYKIHGYARRQLTWFRRFSEIEWIASKEEALESVKKFVV